MNKFLNKKLLFGIDQKVVLFYLIKALKRSKAKP